MNEWILRVMPLPMRSHLPVQAPATVDLARFRIRIVAPPERPGARLTGARQCTYDVGPVRILALDSANPHGGVGGSFDTEQLAWLVQEVERARDRYVVVASHDGSRTLTSTANATGKPPRVCADEVISVLLARAHVIGWISNTIHERSGRRHGDVAHGFWEIPGATIGYGAPLAGGLAVSAEQRHLHRVVVMRGVLSGEAAPNWELKDPLPEVSGERLAELARQ
ncbi:MAG: hypothetical protein GC156_02365 [Actinomycetales bacterium]|nr:hypothetical protein [Actinomycetales bacterium]